MWEGPHLGLAVPVNRSLCFVVGFFVDCPLGLEPEELCVRAYKCLFVVSVYF